MPVHSVAVASFVVPVPVSVSVCDLFEVVLCVPVVTERELEAETYVVQWVW